MENLNYVLFEEFKHLDKICGELYEGQQGVSHYIEDMKEVPESDYRHIPNWKADLEQLVRFRHIRNYLAHTEGAFEEKACTQEDIEWSRDFCKRILNQSDPLAMLYQYIKAKQQTEETKKSVFNSQTSQPSALYDIINETAEDIKPRKTGDMGNSSFILLKLFTIGLILLAVFCVVALIIDYI